MASATPDTCPSPPFLPNILLDDLANVRKEFVMRKSRPSITNVSFCGSPTFRPLSAVRTSVRGLRRRRQILHGYWTPAKSRNSSPISSLSSCSLPGAFSPRRPCPAPSSSGRNYLNQFPSQRQWTVVACCLLAPHLRHWSHSFTCALFLGLLITSLNL